MSNEFYRVTVKAVEQAHVQLEVVLVDPSQALPTGPGWALMTLMEATTTTLESAETPAEQKARAKSALAKALTKALDGRDLEAVCREPGPWVTSVTVRSKKAKSALYDVTLTDAKWGGHVKAGMVFNSTSYGVDEPAPPPPKVKSGELKQILEGFSAPTVAKRAAAFRSLEKLKTKLGHAFTDKLEGAEAALAAGVIGLLRERLTTETFAFSSTQLLRALADLQPTASAFKQVSASLLARGTMGDEAFAWVRCVTFTSDEWVDELRSIAEQNENESVRLDAISALARGTSAGAKAATKKLLPWVKKGASRKDSSDRRKASAYQFQQVLEELS